MAASRCHRRPHQTKKRSRVPLRIDARRVLIYPAYAQEFLRRLEIPDENLLTSAPLGYYERQRIDGACITRHPGVVMMV